MADVLTLVEPMEWLTIGLVLFAGAQVWVQAKAERQRTLERKAENDDAIDRAFHIVWAEHFRIDSLAEDLAKRDLIEKAYLGTLHSSEVLPRDWGQLTTAMTRLGSEASFLGGVAVTLCHDAERAIGVLGSSVRALAEALPKEIGPAQTVQLLRERYGPDLAPWELAVRTAVRELADLLWDVAQHSPRIAISRELNFSDNLRSGFAKAAVEGMQKRATLASKATKPAKPAT